MKPPLLDAARALMTRRADAALLCAIAACALVVLSMPLSQRVRASYADAMHGRHERPLVMAGVQLVPKMYTFANHYWWSPTPLTRQQLSQPPETLERVEFGWVNHYPSWMMNHFWRDLFKGIDGHQGYFYAGATWRGQTLWTGYELTREVDAQGQERVLARRADP